MTKKFKAEFIICGYQGVWFPVATLRFHRKQELVDFVEKYEIYCDCLEVYEGDDRIYSGSLKKFLSSDLVNS